MRWLLIVLLASLLALLIAAAGIVRHIRLHHARIRSKPLPETEQALDLAPVAAEEENLEREG
ncbi:MAG: hypothetical protein ACP5FH_01115 [Terracidiphilus sp.]